MKHNYFFSIITIAYMLLLFSACKKSGSKEPELDAEENQFSIDANRYLDQLNEADYDIIKTLGGFSEFGGVIPSDSLLHYSLCSVNLDSTQVAQKILLFNFNGSTTCPFPPHIRSGQIKVQLTNGIFWNDSNAELTLTYTNFKIFFKSYNQSISFNGVRKLKNLNGIKWVGFIGGDSSIYLSVRANNLSVKNEDNSTALLNFAGTTKLNYVKYDVNPDIGYTHVDILNNGDTTLNGLQTVSMWGLNRYGYSFIISNKTYLLSNSFCGFHLFKSGKTNQKVNNVDYTVDYGFESFGSLACAEKYQIMWVEDGTTYTTLIAYQ